MQQSLFGLIVPPLLSPSTYWHPHGRNRHMYCRKMRESEKRELINELPCTEMVKSGTNELASGSNPSDSTKKDIQFLEISKIFSFESFIVWK